MDSKSNLKSSKDTSYVNRNLKRSKKAVHHIILVRHGQYNIQGNTDNEKSLTNLGKKNSFYR